MHYLTKKEEEIIIKLYEEGKMDSEISKITGICRGTICYFRKRKGLPTKFNYEKIGKIKKEEFLPLFKAGKSDAEIAKILNVKEGSIWWYRKRKGYKVKNRSVSKAIKLSDFQKQVLIGTVLGDGHLNNNGGINTRFVLAHSPKQKELSENIFNIFKNLNAVLEYRKTKKLDIRNNKFYELYWVRIPANPCLNIYYNSFYKNKKKRIPFDLFYNFTEVSLAYLFMDDGSKTTSGYIISTNCFTTEDINKFKDFLYNKWGLETSVFKNNQIYIKANSVKLFNYLISPYILNCCKYKLH